MDCWSSAFKNVFTEMQESVWERPGVLYKAVQRERRGADKTERAVPCLIAATELAGESWELH